MGCGAWDILYQSPFHIKTVSSTSVMQNPLTFILSYWFFSLLWNPLWTINRTHGCSFCLVFDKTRVRFPGFPKHAWTSPPPTALLLLHVCCGVGYPTPLGFPALSILACSDQFFLSEVHDVTKRVSVELVRSTGHKTTTHDSVFRFGKMQHEDINW